MSVKPGTVIPTPGLGIAGSTATPAGAIGTRLLTTLRGETPAEPERPEVTFTAKSFEAMVAGDAGGDALLALAPRELWFEAWLRSIVMRTSDPARAEKTAREGVVERWPSLLAEWDGWKDTIAEGTGPELGRLLDAPADADDYEVLLSHALEGDERAAPLLETAAFRRRELIAFRFARALADGKSALAKFYAGRLG